VIDIRTAAPFVRRFEDRILVLKVGGACLSHAGTRKRLAEDIALVHILGAHVVLVHGAGPQVDQLQRRMGEEPKKVDGRRVTTAAALAALRQATMELNADLAAAISAAGSPALGLSAASAGLLQARRRPVVSTASGPVDFGFVGDLCGVNPLPLLQLIEGGIIPVLGPPAGDGHGGFLNVNADLAAAHVAVALEAAKLVLITSTPGILMDANDPNSLVSALDLEQLSGLEQNGVLKDGMAVKATALRLALEGGVERCHVVSGMSADGLLGELYTNHGTGTLLTRLAEVEDETLLIPEPKIPLGSGAGRPVSSHA
jgi:acetylglutamate kinase